jgi:hypothetical protein
MAEEAKRLSKKGSHSSSTFDPASFQLRSYLKAWPNVLGQLEVNHVLLYTLCIEKLA